MFTFSRLTEFLVKTGSVSLGAASVGHIYARRRTTSGSDGLQPHQNAPQLVFCLLVRVTFIFVDFLSSWLLSSLLSNGC